MAKDNFLTVMKPFLMAGIIVLVVAGSVYSCVMIGLRNALDPHKELNARPAPDRESAAFIQMKEGAKDAVEADFQELDEALPLQFYGSIVPGRLLPSRQ